jgi:hypothetical protein
MNSLVPNGRKIVNNSSRFYETQQFWLQSEIGFTLIFGRVPKVRFKARVLGPFNNILPIVLSLLIYTLKYKTCLKDICKTCILHMVYFEPNIKQGLQATLYFICGSQ